VLALPMLLAGQVKPPVDSWPTYNGDYSGQRFSPLKQMNQLNVKALTLAWVYHPTGGQTPGAIVGGLGPEVPPVAGRETGFGGLQIKATPLMLNGILYFATPDNAWAVDARTGHELWHYFWKTTGGIHIGNRGVGIFENWLFFETPDDYLVSTLACPDRGREAGVLLHAGADHRRQPRDGRHRRRFT
jgi:alcohol dehydrogenase (cytochrome c)